MRFYGNRCVLKYYKIQGNGKAEGKIDLSEYSISTAESHKLSRHKPNLTLYEFSFHPLIANSGGVIYCGSETEESRQKWVNLLDDNTSKHRKGSRKNSFRTRCSKLKKKSGVIPTSGKPKSKRGEEEKDHFSDECTSPKVRRKQYNSQRNAKRHRRSTSLVYSGVFASFRQQQKAAKKQGESSSFDNLLLNESPRGSWILNRSDKAKPKCFGVPLSELDQDINMRVPSIIVALVAALNEAFNNATTERVIKWVCSNADGQGDKERRQIRAMMKHLNESGSEILKLPNPRQFKNGKYLLHLIATFLSLLPTDSLIPLKVQAVAPQILDVHHASKYQRVLLSTLLLQVPESSRNLLDYLQTSVVAPAMTRLRLIGQGIEQIFGNALFQPNVTATGSQLFKLFAAGVQKCKLGAAEYSWYSPTSLKVNFVPPLFEGYFLFNPQYAIIDPGFLDVIILRYTRAEDNCNFLEILQTFYELVESSSGRVWMQTVNARCSEILNHYIIRYFDFSPFLVHFVVPRQVSVAYDFVELSKRLKRPKQAEDVILFKRKYLALIRAGLNLIDMCEQGAQKERCWPFSMKRASASLQMFTKAHYVRKLEHAGRSRTCHALLDGLGAEKSKIEKKRTRHIRILRTFLETIQWNLEHLKEDRTRFKNYHRFHQMLLAKPNLVFNNFIQAHKLHTIASVSKDKPGGDLSFFKRLKAVKKPTKYAAKMLTFIHHTLLSEVPYDEYLHLSFISPAKAPSFHRYSRLCNKLDTWIIEKILEKSTAPGRAKRIEFFIELAMRCHHMRNYAMVFSLANALTAQPIKRLRYSWKPVSDRAQTSLKFLITFTDVSKNYKNYREALDAAFQAQEDAIKKAIEESTRALETKSRKRLSWGDKSTQSYRPQLQRRRKGHKRSRTSDFGTPRAQAKMDAAANKHRFKAQFSVIPFVPLLVKDLHSMEVSSKTIINMKDLTEIFGATKESTDGESPTPSKKEQNRILLGIKHRLTSMRDIREAAIEHESGTATSSSQIGSSPSTPRKKCGPKDARTKLQEVEDGLQDLLANFDSTPIAEKKKALSMILSDLHEFNTGTEEKVNEFAAMFGANELSFVNFQKLGSIFAIIKHIFHCQEFQFNLADIIGSKSEGDSNIIRSFLYELDNAQAEAALHQLSHKREPGK